MFYSIRGELTVCEPQCAVIEAGGVGYRLTVTDRCFGEFSNKIGTEVKLYTHLAVREDGIELFGFIDTQELELFKLLNTVSGVGPKAAINILSSLSPEALVSAVVAQDVKAITSAPGVGSKLASRVILELKDKLAGGAAKFASVQTAVPVQPRSDAAEAVNALTVLGYTRQQAIDSLKGINTEGKSVEAIIREALRALSKE